jgi:hypothetical protein
MRPDACTLDFKQLTNIVQALWVPRDLTPVAGWLTSDEQRTLYALAYILNGPFLEIGAWVGKSASIIAKAIRDSGQYKKFVTSELNPTLANFRPVETGMGFFLPPESSVCLGVATLKSWAEEMEPVLSQPGGVLGALTANLRDLDLLDLVDIRVGDFSNVPKLNYRFIFSDIMHTPNEIRNSLPTLRGIIGGRGVILAAHDWTPENENFIRHVFPVVDSVRYDTLVVYQIADERAVNGGTSL